MMANAQHPTWQTRHMDKKKFAFLEWVEQDLILLKNISTHNNAANNITKILGRQLFYRHRHADTILGRRIPAYIQQNKRLILFSSE